MSFGLISRCLCRGARAGNSSGIAAKSLFHTSTIRSRLPITSLRQSYGIASKTQLIWRSASTTASAFVSETSQHSHDAIHEVSAKSRTTDSESNSAQLPPLSPPIVSRWLLLSASLVFAIVVVGGVTRLTESGLSIVEWRPITGTLPPLSEAEWEAEFEKYKTSPEFKM